jgi:hypothetical protein
MARDGGEVDRTSDEVEQYPSALRGPIASEVRRLRDGILALDDRITEHIKWKAPSFVVSGEDRVTFALRPGRGLEVILHRGVAVRADTATFRFDHDSGIVRWASPDRGIVSLADASAIAAHRDVLLALIRRWIDA